MKTCEGLISLNIKFLITPNTGKKLNSKKYYDLKFNPTRIKLNFLRNFQKG